jgi:hypothetical protein
MAIGGSALEALTEQLQEQLQSYNGGAKKRKARKGGQQQEGGQEQIAGSVKVYTGPKQGKFIINKHGKKVYIDRKTLNNDIPYLKKKVKKTKKAAKK